jgi:hypothetical protein
MNNEWAEDALRIAGQFDGLLNQMEELPFFHLGYNGDQLKDSVDRFVVFFRRFPKNIEADAEMGDMIDEAYLGKMERLHEMLYSSLAYLKKLAYEERHIQLAEQKALNMARSMDHNVELYKSWAKNEVAWTEFLYESRSQRKPAFYRTRSVNPSRGKSQTSRRLRSADKQQMHDITREVDVMTDEELLDEIDPFLDDPQFRKRGSAGTRSPDRGWDDFGDGRVMPQSLENWPEDYRYKMTRK